MSEETGQRLTAYIARTHRFRPLETLEPIYGIEVLLLQRGECYVCTWDRDTETWRELEFYTIIEPEGWLPNREPSIM